MNQILTFFDDLNNAKKAKYVGIVAALCALFMGIEKPDISQARDALAVVQVFWLMILTLGLTSLFYDFVKFTWRNEKVLNKNLDMPFNFVLTATTGVILGSVVFSLWSYMLGLYAKVFASFTILFGFPSFVVIACTLIALYVKKYEDRIPLIFQLLADSVAMGALVMIAGLYLEFAVTKLFQTHWFYPIAPLTSLIFFTLMLVLMLYRKKNLLKAYQNN